MGNTKSLLGFVIAISFIISSMTLSAMMIISCSNTSFKTSNSAKDKAVQLMSIYNSQYALYLSEVDLIVSSAGQELSEEDQNKLEAKKQMLRKKKQIMVELYPYLGLYSTYAEKDDLPPEDVEMIVMELISRLIEI